MSKNSLSALVVGALVLASGCGERSPQVVKGTALLSSFPAALAPSKVRVLRGERVVAHAEVAADGRFRVAIPRGRGYQVRFVSDAGETVLVMPQPDGTVRDRFDVKGGHPFDLGVVRRMSNMVTTKFVFQKTGTATQCSEGVDRDSHDPCIEQDDAKACRDDDGEEHEGEGDDHHGDGEDHHGEEGQGDRHEGGDSLVTPAPPTEAAVADRDLSRDSGCGRHHEEHRDHEERDDHED